jgi:hypothetical protein
MDCRYTVCTHVFWNHDWQRDLSYVELLRAGYDCHRRLGQVLRCGVSYLVDRPLLASSSDKARLGCKAERFMLRLPLVNGYNNNEGTRCNRHLHTTVQIARYKCHQVRLFGHFSLCIRHVLHTLDIESHRYITSPARPAGTITLVDINTSKTPDFHHRQ